MRREAAAHLGRHRRECLHRAAKLGIGLEQTESPRPDGSVGGDPVGHRAQIVRAVWLARATSASA